MVYFMKSVFYIRVLYKNWLRNEMKNIISTICEENKFKRMELHTAPRLLATDLNGDFRRELTMD